MLDGDEPYQLTSKYGSASGKEVRLSENPLSGNATPESPGLADFDGADTEILRGSLQIDWDIGQGTFTSITGATHFEGSEFFEVDYQAIGRPDELLANVTVDEELETDQLSQELRWSSDFDSAWQVAVCRPSS